MIQILSKPAATCAALVAVCGAALDVLATVDLQGTVSYRIDGTVVTLEAERIVNTSDSWTTGTLYLTLWMTAGADPYTTGHRTSRVSLAAFDGSGRLMPGYEYSNVTLVGDFEVPPPGTYFVHLYVSEYPEADTVQDLVTFTDTVTVEPPGNAVGMEGDVAFRIEGDVATLEVERVANNSNFYTTGTLHLTLWMTASADPYTPGHTAARLSLARLDGDGRLPPRHFYTDVRLTGDFARPPLGTYYVHLYLSDSSNLEAALHLVTFTDTVVIEDTSDDHGDVRALATRVRVPSTTPGRLERGGDVDVFRVDLASAGTLRIETTGTVDTYGTLTDERGVAVAIDDDGGESLNFRIESGVDPGSWYVEVRGFRESTTGAYSLSVVFDAAARGPGGNLRPGADRYLGDFDGDGRDDVLLRHTNGGWYYYPMNGRRVAEGRGSANLTKNLDFRVVGIGDFDGDGRDDVLLRHADGRWHYYPMNGRRHIAERAGSANLTTNVGYRMAGIGDFDGDGSDDVLLRHTDGRWHYYPMNGRRHIAERTGSANLTRDVDYRVAGIGDFDGDGRDDVLLRHTDGRWYYYAMNGRRHIAERRGSANLTKDVGYRVAGIGDFDGDGRDDVLLRHADGRWYYYAMDGRRHIAERRGSANLTRNLDYRVAGVGDLDGDGRDDVLLRHADGRWYYYAMDGRRFVPGRRGSVSLSRNLDWGTPGMYAPEHAAIRGGIAVRPGQVLDGDTNDANDPVRENPWEAPQQIASPVSVAGYADADDGIDVYRMHFPAPMRISLAIADAGAADLDLVLADADGVIVEQSLGMDNLEVIQTNRTGEHLIAVEAFSGGGNYVLVASIVETAGGASAASRMTWSRDGEFVPNELIVKPHARPGPPGTAAQLANTASLGFIEQVHAPSGEVLLRGIVPAADDLGGRRYATEELRARAATLVRLKKLKQGRRFDYVQPNRIYRAAAVPDDPYYPNQWHYRQIALPQAWDLTTGSDRVVTAVIDSGIVTDHPDLQERLLRDSRHRVVGYDFISDPAMAGDGDGIDGDPYDVGSRERLGRSSSFHGTHVAGTIGASTDNGVGVAGVTWRGRIMPIRVLGRGGGTDFDISQGIRYAAGLPNSSGELPSVRADVINLSLGTPNPYCAPLPRVSRMREQALTSALDAGVVVVVAAGNEQCHVPGPMTTVDGVISVGAVDHFGRAPYSNFGSTVDVVAPGGDVDEDADGDGYADGVLSVLADDAGAQVEPTYSFSQGTSMAAPHVAGVVGLMLAVNPRLTPSDINRLLDGTHPDPAAAPITRDWGTPGRDDLYGHGLIDAFQAVRVARAIRGGEDLRPDRPVLAVSPNRLYFGATADVLRVELRNVGTGSLTVSTVESDAPWLTVSFDEWPTLVVRADRDGLPEGSFVGHIRIVSDGGDLTVPVTMQVQSTDVEPNIGTVYVLALDPETYETQAHAVTNSDTGYEFAMPTVPLGSYVVVAGTDRNDDGYICDAGEACGIWPLLDSPAVVEVDGDRVIDFGVSIDLFARVSSSSAGATVVGKRGFRIRATEINP